MAKISELPDAGAITSDDYLLIVDDTGGTPVSKRVSAPNAKEYLNGGDGLVVGTDITNNTRMVNQERIVTVGPWRATGGQATFTPTTLILGSAYVAACTINQALVWVMTAANAGDKVFYMIYDIDNTGLPTTLLHSFEITVGTSTGYLGSATGLNTRIKSGFRWVGAFAPTANTSNTFQLKGGIPSIQTVGNGGGLANNIWRLTYSGSAPPSSLAAVNFGPNSGEFVTNSGQVPLLFGRD